MDPLSIYWNSVWQDAQRPHQDGAGPATAARRSDTLLRRGARHPKAVATLVLMALISVGAILSAF